MNQVAKKLDQSASVFTMSFWALAPIKTKTMNPTRMIAMTVTAMKTRSPAARLPPAPAMGPRCPPAAGENVFGDTLIA